MIISKTPFRVSFFGGGTDYPAWYKEHEGQVLSTTIDKYCYISVRNLPPFFPYKHRVVYSKIEEVQDIEEIKLPPVKSALKLLDIKGGVSIHHEGDLPARTGLGSSSAFSVGLLQCLHMFQGKEISKDELAKEAIHFERDILQENVGSQDQVAVTHGGLNKISFSGDDKVRIEPVEVSKERKKELESHVVLYFTGFSRNATDVAREQIENTQAKEKELQRMSEMVDEAMGILQNPTKDIAEFGKLLHESWELKKNLSDKITNPEIDAIYERALQAGAIGGKLIGAGGGGFMLLFIPLEKQAGVKEALHDLLEVRFQFEQEGSQIIYNNKKI